MSDAAMPVEPHRPDPRPVSGAPLSGAPLPGAPGTLASAVGPAEVGPSSARLAAATALRRLGHALVARQVPDDVLERIATRVDQLTDRLQAMAPRQRPAPTDLFTGSAANGPSPSHFPDCVVTGAANPMGMDARVERRGREGVLTATLGAAFEGAPGRAHGGVVAALLDEAMGVVLSIVGTPAYTGRLTVTYRAPTPLQVPLEFRARLLERQGRKLHIAAEGRHGDTVIAEAKALFIAVDPQHFASGGRHPPRRHGAAEDPAPRSG